MTKRASGRSSLSSRRRDSTMSRASMAEGDELPAICILAGGLGARLGALVTDTPKPLLEVAGEPFLLHQLRLLAAHGARNVVLCVGYLGERIEKRIGDDQFGIRIAYSYVGPVLQGTFG